MMLIVAHGVFHLQFFSLGLPLAAFVLLLFVFGITLGILATAIVLRFGPASEWLMWPLPALLSPFAAVFYPLPCCPAGCRGGAGVAAVLRVRGYAEPFGRGRHSPRDCCCAERPSPRSSCCIAAYVYGACTGARSARDSSPDTARRERRDYAHHSAAHHSAASRRCVASRCVTRRSHHPPRFRRSRKRTAARRPRLSCPRPASPGGSSRR